MSRSGDASSGPVAAMAKRVLNDMSRLDIAPSPQNYHIWSEYMGASNPELCRAIEGRISSDEGFSDEVLEDLYNEFIRNEKLHKELKRAQRATQTVLKDVLAELVSVGSMTSEYQRKLEYYAEKLDSAPSGVEFHEVLGDLLKDTSEMAQASIRLVRNLEKTQSRTETLGRQLHRIEREGLIDHLTGLGNRKALDDILREFCERSVENKQTFSIVVMKLDEFETFRQNHGQQIGEAVLRRVAKMLKDNLKGYDFIARSTDEKFAAVLPGTPLDSGVSVAEILREALAGMRLQKADSETELGSVTASLGVVEFDLEETFDGLLGRADEALAAAIRLGGNRVTTERDL